MVDVMAELLEEIAMWHIQWYTSIIIGAGFHTGGWERGDIPPKQLVSPPPRDEATLQYTFRREEPWDVPPKTRSPSPAKKIRKSNNANWSEFTNCKASTLTPIFC